MADPAAANGHRAWFAMDTHDDKLLIIMESIQAPVTLPIVGSNLLDEYGNYGGSLSTLCTTAPNPDHLSHHRWHVMNICNSPVTPARHWLP